VLAGSVGGDGTREMPFGSIAEALQQAQADTTIAVGKGSYPEPPLVWNTTARIVGACSAETEITASRDDATLIEAQAGRAELSGIAVVGPEDAPALRIAADAVARLNGVRLVAGASGIVVNGRFEARDLVATTATATAAAGVRVMAGAVVSLERSWLAGFGEPSLRLGLDSQTQLTDVVLVGAGRAGRVARRGVQVGESASLEAERLVVQGFSAVAIEVAGELTLRHGVLRTNGAELRSGEASGSSLVVPPSGRATVSTTSFENAFRTAVYVAGTVRLDDVVVDTVAPRAVDGRHGFGLDVSGGTLTAERVRIRDTRRNGVRVTEAGSAEIADLDLQGVRFEEQTGDAGYGVRVGFDGTLLLERARIVDTQVAGLLVALGGSARVTDLRVSDTVTREGRGGFGVHVAFAEAVALERAELLRNGEAGLRIDGGDVPIEVTDLRVEDTLGVDDGRFGSAIVGAGATLSLTRAALLRSQRLGLFAGLRSDIVATELSVADVRRAACMNCEMNAIGVGSFQESAVVVDGFRVTGSASCGFMLGDDGAIDARRGRVEDNRIGVCLQVEGYDTSRLEQDVEYRNETNLQATRLPVPRPAAPPPPG
jgi:hypothetical protein